MFLADYRLISTLRSNEQHDIKTMTNRGTIKLKLAQEFCRWSGASTTFRTLVPPRPGDGEKESYHNTYRAIDIRHARLRLMDVFEEPTRPRTIPPIVNVRMAKGGTGKTTVAANLAACIAMQGHRVLMIDADPQASLTTMWGIDWAVEDITHIGHLLQANESKTDKLTREELEGAIRPIYSDGMLDLIASDITLTDIDTWLTSVMGRELLVAKLLNAHVDVFSRYDAIIIDGAPGTTQLSNALAYAAPHLLAVVMLDGQSIKAMEVLAANMQEMHEAFPDRPFDVRIVANKFSSQITACRDALETLRAAYPGKLDSNIIPTAAGFLRQVSLVNEEDSGPVIEREPSSPAARVMVDLSRSVIGAYDIQLAGLTPVVMPRRQGGSSAVRAAMKKAAQQEPDEQAAQPGGRSRASKKAQAGDAATAKERA
jgi:chromosome partitioning protein